MTLFVDRLVYAFNWYNVGAILLLIGRGLAIGTAELGVVLGAFLVGVGIFQVPAGFAAIRFGARRVSVAALFGMGFSAVASAFAPSFLWLALARFGVGVGAAFFFSPALGLVASYFPAGRRGPVIGFYNGGFALGGALALVGGAFLGARFGWSLALLVGGVGLVALALLSLLTLPRVEAEGLRGSRTELWRAGLTVLRSRSILALSVALTGLWAAFYIVAQYFIAYAETDHAAWGTVVPPVLAALVVFVSFPGGPVGGWIGERSRDHRITLGVFGGVAGVCVLAIPFTPLLGLWPLLVGLGFLEGIVFSLLYLIPTYLPESREEGFSLGVAVVNSIQVSIGSALAIVFGFLAAGSGYLAAWVFAAVIGFATLPLLSMVEHTGSAELRVVGSVRASPGGRAETPVRRPPQRAGGSVGGASGRRGRR